MEPLDFIPDSLKTSGSDQQSLGIIDRHLRSVVVREAQVRYTVTSRKFDPREVPIIRWTDSARPGSLKCYLTIKADDTVGRIISFKDATDTIFVRSQQILNQECIELTVIGGPSRESWTVPSWNFEEPTEDIRSSLIELRTLLNQMKNRLPLTRSDEIVNLAKQAVERTSVGAEIDIQAWAQRLMQDVSGADD